MNMPAERPLTIHCSGPWQARPETAAPEACHGSIRTFFATLASLRHRINPYLELLDADEKARADRFRHAHDRERFILGHGLLRELLGRQLHQLPEELLLHRGEFGKPYLEGHPVHFNLSDTKDAVLVALADEPIGADIETMNRNTDHDRVAGHYFTPPEVESINQAADGKRRFLELWTRKEAVLKACGVGLMDDLHSLEVGGALNTMTISHPDFVRLAAPEYHVQTLTVGPDHIVSLACASVMRHWYLAVA
mgnify:CR=1 FL=1